MKYIVNKKILKAARDAGHCVCDLGKPCPCNDYLERDECICGAYKPAFEFDSYQEQAMKTNVSKNVISSEYTYYLLGLAGETGEVVEKFKKMFRNDGGEMSEEFKQSIKKELGDVLWYITAIGDMLGFSLEDIAITNNEKTLSRLERGKIKSEGDER